MTPEDLKKRTQRFGLDVIAFVGTLPKDYVTFCLAKQLVRCATSVGANYRAACRARSAPDFIAKMKIVEEEADEAVFWLEMLSESGLASQDTIAPLHSEASQLVAITVASIKTKRNSA